MLHSESLTKLANALSLAQAEMPRVKFNATNPFLKNKFADLGAVVETSRPILAKHKLSITQFPTSDGEHIGVTSILMHESGEWLQDTVTMPLEGQKGLSAAQVAGSIITYLRRYSWAAILGMYADEDTDGSHPEKKEPKKEGEPETKKEVPEADKKQAVLAAWHTLMERAKVVNVKLAVMDGKWDSAKMRQHYQEQKHFVEQAEAQKEAA